MASNSEGLDEFLYSTVHPKKQHSQVWINNDILTHTEILSHIMNNTMR